MQLALFQFEVKNLFGGTILKSHPKCPRPFSRKQALHLVLRSSLAKGEKSFLQKKHRKTIEALVHKQARDAGLKIFRYQNVGNHLHILVRVYYRPGLAKFLRAISGIIARKVLGAERGRGQDKQFWDGRPCSRVVHWGRDYKGVLGYFEKNRLQAIGFERPTYFEPHVANTC